MPPILLPAGKVIHRLGWIFEASSMIIRGEYCQSLNALRMEAAFAQLRQADRDRPRLLSCK
jgi:hypothetical protein